jgi:hypothetical protein
MAVTKEVYTAASTWTASQLATLFTDAFIDAGLMTDWYDSFVSSSIESRVLEITYDGAKTYGKAYYWFMFTTSGVFISVATGWNTTTNVPTGTARLDYFQTTATTTSNHVTVATGLSTGTAVELVRYTSGSNSAYSWFTLRNGATPIPFFIAPAATSIAPWIDLDKVMFHHFIPAKFYVSTTGSAGRASVEFVSAYQVGRSYTAGGALRLSFDDTSAFALRTFTLGYTAMGNSQNNFGSNWAGEFDTVGKNVIVPYGFNNVNPAYTTDYQPVINGYSYSHYISSVMPTDFGVVFNFGTTAFSYADRIIVTAAVEEWEIYGFANNTGLDAPSALIVSRVV